jgi:hypothetical protein
MVDTEGASLTKQVRVVDDNGNDDNIDLRLILDIKDIM